MELLYQHFHRETVGKDISGLVPNMCVAKKIFGDMQFCHAEVM